MYGAGFNQDYVGGQSAGAGRYWYAATPVEFSMAPDAQALVDYRYGAASRCRDVKGVLTDPQAFVDDAKWGAEPVTPTEASRYSWLQAPELARRQRFAGCESSFRRKVLEGITNPAVGRSYAWVEDLFERVRDRGDGCVHPSPWPGSAPSG